MGMKPIRSTGELGLRWNLECAAANRANHYRGGSDTYAHL